MNRFGKLVLIPTPIDEDSPLEQTAFNLLKKAYLEEKDHSLFVIEDLKPGRRRWLRFGLPREVVNDFVLYNEHNADLASRELALALESGKNVYLMSDGGLPAFCDPGVRLVNICHQRGIRVTSTPFSNSISLALALSGFSHDRFVFEGFLPVKKDKRMIELNRIVKARITTILMDTPYRLKNLLNDIDLAGKKAHISLEIFLAMDLNMPSEELYRGMPKVIIKKITNFKREFILICR